MGHRSSALSSWMQEERSDTSEHRDRAKRWSETGEQFSTRFPTNKQCAANIWFYNKSDDVKSGWHCFVSRFIHTICRCSCFMACCLMPQVKRTIAYMHYIQSPKSSSSLNFETWSLRVTYKIRWRLSATISQGWRIMQTNCKRKMQQFHQKVIEVTQVQVKCELSDMICINV